jgi:acetyl-CoA C-acetyltransferase
MNEAVIVSTAQTPIGRAGRGAFNLTQAPTWAATSSAMPSSAPAA